MPEARKLKLGEYECTTCKVVIYGDDLSLKRHKASQTIVQNRKTGFYTYLKRILIF